MKKTIGILGGMGPLATADLMAKIAKLTKASCDAEHIRVYVDSNPSIPDRTAAILNEGPDPVEEMASALRHLESCGADCIIMPCNTAHWFLPRLQGLTKTPFLDMTRIAAQCCSERFSGKRIAVLATTGTLSTGLYEKALAEQDVPCLLPDEEEQKILMHLIYDVVKASRPLAPEADTWHSLLEGLRSRGADAFLLACTELPVLAEELREPGPFIDTTEELARAAIQYCGYECVE